MYVILRKLEENRIVMDATRRLQQDEHHATRQMIRAHLRDDEGYTMNDQKRDDIPPA